MTRLCSETSRSYPGRSAQLGRGQASLQPVGLARNPGTDRWKPLRAVQKSAEVMVPILERQSRREGPNDEEQGGAIGSLTAREPLGTSRPVLSRRRWHRDYRFSIPTGRYRRDARRAASLERLHRVTDAASCRRGQPRNRLEERETKPWGSRA